MTLYRHNLLLLFGVSTIITLIGCGPNTPFTDKNALLARQMGLQDLDSDQTSTDSTGPSTLLPQDAGGDAVTDSPSSEPSLSFRANEGSVSEPSSPPAVSESDTASTLFTHPANQEAFLSRKPIILDTGHDLLAAHLGGIGQSNLTACTIEGGDCKTPVSVDVSNNRMEGTDQLPLFMPVDGRCSYLAEIRYVEGEGQETIDVDSPTRPSVSDHSHRFYIATRNTSIEDQRHGPTWEEVLETSRENWLLFSFREDFNAFDETEHPRMNVALHLDLDQAQIILESLALLNSGRSLTLNIRDGLAVSQRIDPNTEIYFCPSGTGKDPLISGFIKKVNGKESEKSIRAFVAFPRPIDA